MYFFSLNPLISTKLFFILIGSIIGFMEKFYIDIHNQTYLKYILNLIKYIFKKFTDLFLI